MSKIIKELPSERSHWIRRKVEVEITVQRETIHERSHRHSGGGRRSSPRLVKGLGSSRRAKVDHWLAERVFVSCALDDDLPYVTNKLGDEFIVTATDFPHGDAFRQDHLAQGLMKRGDLSDKLIEKILSANPRRLYSMVGD